MDLIYENWEGLIALFALFVSAFSSIVTFFTFKLQRTHNQKSFKPILYVAAFDYENCIKVELRNEGVGPALISKLKVEKNEHEAKTCIFHWLPEKLPGNMNYKEYWTRDKDFVLRQGKSIELLELKLDSKIAEQKTMREKIRGTLRNLTVVIRYEDVYENSMVEYRRKLDLFARVDNEN